MSYYNSPQNFGGNNFGSNYGSPPPTKTTSYKWLWILLGTFAGVFVLGIAACCGGLYWSMSFPSVSASASEPWEVTIGQTPTFREEIPTSHLREENGIRQNLIAGDGSGFGAPPGANMSLWVYKPQGIREPRSLPCVLICGAGSTLMEGMLLGDGDEPEHLPYLKAGMVVVAYTLDGPSEDEPNRESYEAFRASSAGLVNAKIALEYTLKNVPEVDPSRIYSAGHSSAGTMSLLFAAHEPRLAGCIAYAPCTDLKERLPGPLVRALSTEMPGLADFLVRESPRTHESRIHCPVFVFHAADDSNVDIEESRGFVERLKRQGTNAVLKETPIGDHYDAMIDEGIDQAIDWIKTQPKA